MTRMQQEQHCSRRPGVVLLPRPRRRMTATSTAAAVKSSTMIRQHTRSRCLVQTSPGGGGTSGMSAYKHDTQPCWQLQVCTRFTRRWSSLLCCMQGMAAGSAPDDKQHCRLRAVHCRGHIHRQAGRAAPVGECAGQQLIQLHRVVAGSGPQRWHGNPVRAGADCLQHACAFGLWVIWLQCRRLLWCAKQLHYMACSASAVRLLPVLKHVPKRDLPVLLSVQAYGAGAYLRVGVILQRALLVCWTVCLPVVLLWSQVCICDTGWGRSWTHACMAAGRQAV